MSIEVADVLRRARDLVTSAWTQGFSARDVDGEIVDARTHDAACWCATGAIQRAAGGSNHVFDRAYFALHEVVGHVVPLWNDEPTRTKDDVINAFTRAIEREEKRA